MHNAPATISVQQQWQHCEFLNKGYLHGVMSDRLNACGMFTHTFPSTLCDHLKDIVRNVIRRRDSKIKVESKLLNLMVDCATEEPAISHNKIIECFKWMVQTLPVESLDVEEMELIARFIQPCLQPLFENINENILFKFTNSQKEEHQDNEDYYNRRPDGCITATVNSNTFSLGFLEVKTSKYKKNRNKLNFDLYRLGAFSRDSTNANNLDTLISLQIIGTTVTFYLFERKSNNMYLMTKLDEIMFLTTLGEIPQLFGFMDNLCDILHIYHTKVLPPSRS